MPPVTDDVTKPLFSFEHIALLGIIVTDKADG